MSNCVKVMMTVVGTTHARSHTQINAGNNKIFLTYDLHAMNVGRANPYAASKAKTFLSTSHKITQFSRE